MLMRAVLFFAVCVVAVQAGFDPSLQSAGKRKVLVLGLDGTRGDVLHQAMFQDNIAPNIRSLAEAGKFAPCLESDDPNCARAHNGHLTGDDFVWCTAPGWGSVLTGVNNDKTLVRGNDELQQVEFHYTTKTFPTFMMMARNHGYRTAASGAPNFISSWTEDPNRDDIGIIDFECPLSNRTHIGMDVRASSSCNLDHRAGQSEADPHRDEKTTAFGLERIRNDDADVIMLHFDLIDHAGHTFNFSHNPGYLKAIRVVDGQVGSLLENIRTASSERAEDWLIMLTSDHGGHLTSHDVDKINDTAVPFIVAPYGMASPPAMVNLKPTVRHFDVNPTVNWWMGFEQSKYDIDGQVQGFDTASTATSQETLAANENMAGLRGGGLKHSAVMV